MECPKKDTSVDKVQNREEGASKQKGCPHLFKEEEEDEEERVMATVCYSSEAYSLIQPNREDGDYYKQLNQ